MNSDIPPPDRQREARVAPPSDTELVARCRLGERDALEMLLRRHYRIAFAVALAHARNHADAEDICHDALLRATDRLDDCRDPERFASWLCTIVRNLARNFLTRGFLRRATSRLEHATAASTDDSFRSVELRELRGRLKSALGQLSPIQREVLLLHDMHDCSHDVIAGIIGTSAGMSRQHLFNARRRMRETLGPNTFAEYSR